MLYNSPIRLINFYAFIDECLFIVVILRKEMLSGSDWTQANDSPLSTLKKTEWQTYRQALRDLPANTTDPRSPSWPTQPS